MRVLGYDGASYRDQIFYEKGKDDKRVLNHNPRYPVITLVLYFGAHRWNKARTLYDSLDNVDERLSPYISDYKMNCI